MEDKDVINELNEIRKLTALQVKEFLSVSEVALYLDRSESTIRSMAQKGQLGYTRPFGKEMYFSKSEINRILRNGFVPSVSTMIENR